MYIYILLFVKCYKRLALSTITAKENMMAKKKKKNTTAEYDNDLLASLISSHNCFWLQAQSSLQQQGAHGFVGFCLHRTLRQGGKMEVAPASTDCDKEVRSETGRNS